MKKWIPVIALFVICTGIFAWRADWLNSESSDANNLLAYVPADTIFYMGGSSADKMAEFMEGYPFMPSSPSQSVMWDGILHTADQDNSPKARFVAYLISEYKKFSDGTLGGFTKFTGLSYTGAYAIYSDGMIPVMRMHVADSDILNTLIENAVVNSEWQYTWEDIGGVKARLWPLTAEGEDLSVYLAVTNHENSAVITFVTSRDDLTAKQRRFGVIKPNESLANSSDITELKKRYNYSDDILGFIQFEQIAQSVLAPEENSLGRDFLTYLPKEKFQEYQQKISTACRTEYGQLAAAMPRLVMGYQTLDFSNTTMTFSMHSAVELKHAPVVAELQKMQGHLPAHSTDAKNKIMAWGLAINTETLAPALTALWSQFTNASFDCEHLQSAQAKLREKNPAMLGMAMGMVNGVRGLGMSFFDVAMSEDNPLPSSLDLIVSIAAEDPVTLAAMAKMLPFLADTTLPDDGTAVSLNLPMLPANINVKAAIKGKHIVVYSGEKSMKVADTLTAEAITPNGLFSMALNYRKFGDLMNLGNLNSLTSQAGGKSACIQQYEMAHMFQNMKMDIGIVMRMEPEGVVTQYKGSMDKPVLIEPNLIGKFQVDMLDDNCQWQPSAMDEIRADSTGTYSEKSDDGACDLYASTYSWTKTGSVVSFGSSEQIRETCSDEFPAPENEIYTCYLMNVKTDSFQCLYDPATEDVSLYRYKRM